MYGKLFHNFVLLKTLKIKHRDNNDKVHAQRTHITLGIEFELIYVEYSMS